MTDEFFQWDVVADGSHEYVPSNDNGMVEDGEIYADDLGVCVGLAVYDTETDTGYMSHLGTVGRVHDDFFSQVQEFLGMMPEIEDPELAVVGGGYPDVSDTVDTDLSDNTTVETYKVGGLKTAAARLLEENFDTEAEFHHAGKKDTELYINSEQGIEVERRGSF